MLHADFDWKRPDYAKAIRQRISFLKYIREKPEERLPPLKAYYKDNPADFISDWGVTFDPRNADIGLPTLIPFVLFPRQREWIDWTLERWRSRTRGGTEKARDCGVTWEAIALSCTLCLFHEGLSIGFGSRVIDLVDEKDTFKPILPKGRIFMENLPREFKGDWLPQYAPYMRIRFPETGSLITGEGGDQVGRGDRQAIYFVDESAYLEHDESVEHALSFTTNCRIDISSVNGMNNLFAKHRHSGKISFFIFDWRQDPRKDEFWYQSLSMPTDQFIVTPYGLKIFGKGFDEVTIAQEVDRDYSASVSGIAVPSAWVRSAIDAHVKLGYPEPTGARGMSLDVADEGIDKNAACVTKGILVEWADVWSGKGGDIFQTVERAFSICDDRKIWEFDYDADGLGAGVRGDARIINQRRAHAQQRPIAAHGFRGSEAVVDPDKIVEGTLGREGDKGRTNKDMFANRKAQGWWALRRRFQLTHRWIAEGIACRPDDIISISSKFPACMALVAELSQATYETNALGKIVIDKTPDGMKSPNLADAVMMRFAPKGPRPVLHTMDMVRQIQRAGRRPMG